MGHADRQVVIFSPHSRATPVMSRSLDAKAKDEEKTKKNNEASTKVRSASPAPPSSSCSSLRASRALRRSRRNSSPKPLGKEPRLRRRKRHSSLSGLFLGPRIGEDEEDCEEGDRFISPPSISLLHRLRASLLLPSLVIPQASSSSSSSSSSVLLQAESLFSLSPRGVGTQRRTTPQPEGAGRAEDDAGGAATTGQRSGGSSSSSFSALSSQSSSSSSDPCSSSRPGDDAERREREEEPQDVDGGGGEEEEEGSRRGRGREGRGSRGGLDQGKWRQGRGRRRLLGLEEQQAQASYRRLICSRLRSSLCKEVGARLKESSWGGEEEERNSEAKTFADAREDKTPVTEESLRQSTSRRKKKRSHGAGSPPFFPSSFSSSPRQIKRQFIPSSSSSSSSPSSLLSSSRLLSRRFPLLDVVASTPSCPVRLSSRPSSSPLLSRRSGLSEASDHENVERQGSYRGTLQRCRSESAERESEGGEGERGGERGVCTPRFLQLEGERREEGGDDEGEKERRERDEGEEEEEEAGAQIEQHQRGRRRVGGSPRNRHEQSSREDSSSLFFSSDSSGSPSALPFYLSAQRRRKDKCFFTLPSGACGEEDRRKHPREEESFSEPFEYEEERDGRRIGGIDVDKEDQMSDTEEDEDEEREEMSLHMGGPEKPYRTLHAPDLLDDFYLNLLDWSGDDLLAVALKSRLLLWKTHEGHPLPGSTQHLFHDGIVCIQFSPRCPSLLFVGFRSGQAEIWDVERGSKLRSLRGHTSRCAVASWGLSSLTLATGGRDQKILIRDLREKSSYISCLSGHGSELCGLAVSPSETMLASGGNDNLLCVWDYRMLPPSASPSAAYPSSSSSSSSSSSCSPPRFSSSASSVLEKSLQYPSFPPPPPPLLTMMAPSSSLFSLGMSREDSSLPSVSTTTGGGGGGEGGGEGRSLPSVSSSPFHFVPSSSSTSSSSSSSLSSSGFSLPQSALSLFSASSSFHAVDSDRQEGPPEVSSEMSDRERRRGRREVPRAHEEAEEDASRHASGPPSSFSSSESSRGHAHDSGSAAVSIAGSRSTISEDRRRRSEDERGAVESSSHCHALRGSAPTRLVRERSGPTMPYVSSVSSSSLPLVELTNPEQGCSSSSSSTSVHSASVPQEDSSALLDAPSSSSTSSRREGVPDILFARLPSSSPAPPSFSSDLLGDVPPQNHQLLPSLHHARTGVDTRRRRSIFTPLSSLLSQESNALQLTCRSSLLSHPEHLQTTTLSRRAPSSSSSFLGGEAGSRGSLFLLSSSSSPSLLSRTLPNGITGGPRSRERFSSSTITTPTPTTSSSVDFPSSSSSFSLSRPSPSPSSSPRQQPRNSSAAPVSSSSSSSSPSSHPVPGFLLLPDRATTLLASKESSSPSSSSSSSTAPSMSKPRLSSDVQARRLLLGSSSSAWSSLPCRFQSLFPAASSTAALVIGGAGAKNTQSDRSSLALPPRRGLLLHRPHDAEDLLGIACSPESTRSSLESLALSPSLFAPCPASPSLVSSSLPFLGCGTRRSSRHTGREDGGAGGGLLSQDGEHDDHGSPCLQGGWDPLTSLDRRLLLLPRRGVFLSSRGTGFLQPWDRSRRDSACFVSGQSSSSSGFSPPPRPSVSRGGGSKTAPCPLFSYQEHSAAVKAVAWSPHASGLLASGGGTADRHIRFWNTNLSSSSSVYQSDMGCQVCNIRFSPHSHEILSTHGFSLNQIFLWTYKPLLLSSSSPFSSAFSSFSSSSHSQTLSDSTLLRAFSSSSSGPASPGVSPLPIQKRFTLSGHTSRVLFVALSPCGTRAVTGAGRGDESLNFWDVFFRPRKDFQSFGRRRRGGDEEAGEVGLNGTGRARRKGGGRRRPGLWREGEERGGERGTPRVWPDRGRGFFSLSSSSSSSSPGWRGLESRRGSLLKRERMEQLRGKRLRRRRRLDERLREGSGEGEADFYDEDDTDEEKEEDFSAWR